MSKEKRCVALVTEAFGATGGIAQYNRDFLRAVAKNGLFESILVLPRYAASAADVPMGMKQLPMQPSRLGYSARALRLIQSEPAQVLFCGHLYMAPLAAFLARLGRAKLIVQMHGIEAWQTPNQLNRIAVDAADLVLCVSRYTRAAVLGWATIAPERVIVLPNTIEEKFNPGDGSRLKSKLGLDGKQILLTVGRMDSRERYKGHDRVIGTLPRLIAEGHDVSYVIVGDGEDRARLEVLAAETGIFERVIFLGQLEPHRLVEAYRMADLFVMPSTREGFGIAFIEAMACGTPALGLTMAGAIDALGDGDLGVAASEADFAAVLSRQLAQPRPDRERLAAAVRGRFGQEAFAANLRSIFLPLLREAA